METKQEVLQTLKGLLTVCRTSEIGYQKASEAVESPTARELLKGYSDQRKEFSEELLAEIKFHDGTETRISPPAYGWTEISEAIQYGDEQEIINACQHSEEAMVRVYENALAKRLPWDVQSVLSYQYSKIKEAFYLIGALELFSHQFVV